jgi:hypothetical protein
MDTTARVFHTACGPLLEKHVDNRARPSNRKGYESVII